MKGYKIILLSMMLSKIAISQEIKFGIHIGSNILQKFDLIGTSYQPKNSVYTYLPEEKGGDKLINHISVLNSLRFGANIRISRKKIGLNIEPELLLEAVRFTFKSPYKSERFMNRKAYRLPIYGTYHLFKNTYSPHITIGTIAAYEKVYDFQQPDNEYYVGKQQEIYKNKLDFGDNHFNNIYYNHNIPFRLSYMIGIGQKIKSFNFSARYVNIIPILKQANYSGKRWQIEFNLTYYFISNKDITKKNYLYEE